MQPTPGFRGTVRYLGVVCPVTDSTHEPNTVQVQVHGVQIRVPWDKVEVVEDYEVRDAAEIRRRLADTPKRPVILADPTTNATINAIMATEEMTKKVSADVAKWNALHPTIMTMAAAGTTSHPAWSLDGPQSPDDILYPNLFGKR